MKAFLWHEIKECSDSYHPEGGVIIEAETLERARELAVISQYRWNKDTKCSELLDPKPMVGISAKPDLILDSPSKAEKVWVFPNAGCC